jgi:formylmethanofuran dehydrogenase subunit E
MDRAEALRSIRYDQLQYIQKKVRVDFDNARQMPVSFTFDGKKHVVEEVLGRFRMQKELPVNAFLVNESGGEIYFLYFEFCDVNQRRSIQAGFWVLSFRILGDRELMVFYQKDRKMPGHAAFQRIVDFHGRTCPDLVIGGKLCDYVQKLFSGESEWDGQLSIIAENCTSALDAIQIMLGATIGNQRLRVMDFGKHNYKFSLKTGRNGFRLSLKRQHYGDEDEYHRLEQDILKNKGTLDEMVHFQKLLDGRMEQLLGSAPEELFDVEPIEPSQQSAETVDVCLICCRCGEQLLSSRKIDHPEGPFCIPCFQRLNNGCTYRSLQ